MVLININSICVNGELTKIIFQLSSTQTFTVLCCFYLLFQEVECKETPLNLQLITLIESKIYISSQMVYLNRDSYGHLTYELCHEKTSLWVRVRHKPGCTTTEDGLRLEISKELGSKRHCSM